jgi:hypothetical protein
MKNLIKKILKEEEFQLNKFYIPMFKDEDGDEWVISFESSYDNDWDEYGRLFIGIHDLAYYYKNPQELVKLGYNTDSTVEYNRRFWLEALNQYRMELDQEEDEQWIDYSGFDFTENDEGIEALENLYIVEFHTSVIRNDETSSDFDKLNESEGDGWEWADEVDIPYRYFRIDACADNYYDEERMEDFCHQEVSYYVKIPADIVPNIWEYTVEDEYYAGPGDEGLDVIEWSLENGLIEEPDGFDGVMEISKEKYCNNWGYNDTDLCGK